MKPAGDAEDFDPDQPGQEMGAIEQFDQLGKEADTEATEQGESEGAGEDPSSSGGSSQTLLMEKWLEQVEGNPAYLLKNQFMLEEQRVMSTQGGLIREPRPW